MINETKNCVKYLTRKLTRLNQWEEIKIPPEWLNDKIKVCDFSGKDIETIDEMQKKKFSKRCA